MEVNANISQSIIDTINTIFEKLFTSIDLKLYEVLDELTFIKADILKDKNFGEIFGTSANNGILLISNSLLIGVIIYFSIKYFTSNFTLNKTQNPMQFIIKLIIYGIVMNNSYFVIEQILNLNSNISSAIRSIGEDLFGQNICFSNLISLINSNLGFTSNELNIFSVDGIIKGTATISLVNLVTVYALRYIMIKILILIAPFAILSLCMEKTSSIFKLWSRNFISMLIIQNIVSLVLLLLFSINSNSNDLITKFIYVGGIYALIRANTFVREFMMGAGFSINIQNIGLIKR